MKKKSKLIEVDKLLPHEFIRPQPPKKLGTFDGYPINIVPAYDLPLWIKNTLLNPDSKLFNNDHYHLYDYIDDKICFLWAAAGFTKQMKSVVGQAEQVMFRAGGFQRMRQEQQLMEWFGYNLPEFIITLDGNYCSQCADSEFMALLEHELYHIGHASDGFGAPKFHRDNGLPVLAMRGHDVEEFIGVVRRYGAGDKDSLLNQMVEAAKVEPEVNKVDIAHACGTCLRLVK